MTDAMTRAGLLDQTGGFALTPAGLAWLTDTLGLSPDGLRPGRRPLARGCLGSGFSWMVKYEPRRV